MQALCTTQLKPTLRHQHRDPKTEPAFWAPNRTRFFLTNQGCVCQCLVVECSSAPRAKRIQYSGESGACWEVFGRIVRTFGRCLGTSRGAFGRTFGRILVNV